MNLIRSSLGLLSSVFGRGFQRRNATLAVFGHGSFILDEDGPLDTENATISGIFRSNLSDSLWNPTWSCKNGFLYRESARSNRLDFSPSFLD